MQMQTYQFEDKPIRLRTLDDEEYDRAEHLARLAGRSLIECPTCEGREEEIQGSGGVMEFVSRTFHYRGDEYLCSCQGQMALYRHYLVAGIPDQYMRLDWREYTGPEEVKSDVAMYLRNWKSMRLNGMGLEFGGENMGVGKTFGATHVGKELVKLGQRIYFTPFDSAVGAIISKDEAEIHRFMNTPFLILDEVLPPVSEAQRLLYEFKLEEIIRHRTNYNMPTIMTTNMTEDDLGSKYPRTYSLLSAKQIRVDLSGADARKDLVQQENITLSLNGEVRPIT